MASLNTPGELIAVHTHQARQPGQIQLIPAEITLSHSLSWAARGLMAFLLSLPAQQSFDVDELAACSPDQRDQLISALRELEAHGLIACRKGGNL